MADPVARANVRAGARPWLILIVAAFMGLTLEFLAGDKDLIAEAVRSGDYGSLNSPPACSLRADFSLHLIPSDLDLMSRSLGEVAGISPHDLRPYLVPVVDEEEHGALAVSSAWIQYVAECYPVQAETVARLWTAKLNRAHPGEEIDCTEAMIEAVRDWIYLSKKAVEDSLDVVHIWSL